MAKRGRGGDKVGRGGGHGNAPAASSNRTRTSHSKPRNVEWERELREGKQGTRGAAREARTHARTRQIEILCEGFALDLGPRSEPGPARGRRDGAATAVSVTETPARTLEPVVPHSARSERTGGVRMSGHTSASTGIFACGCEVLHSSRGPTRTHGGRAREVIMKARAFLPCCLS